MQKHDVFIFCAGLGTRLRPYTETIPKPVLPFRDGTCMLYQICEKLRIAGVKSVIVNYSYGREYFEIYQQRINDALGISVELVFEPEPLGHGGGLKNAQMLLHRKGILAINGDTCLDFNQELIDELTDRFEPREIFRILGIKREDNNPLGVDKHGKILRIRERRLAEGNETNTLDAIGAYFFQREILEYVEPNVFTGIFGLDDLVERVSKDKKLVRVVPVSSGFRYISMGTRDDYENTLASGYSWSKAK
ncbi:MAG: sugar phosphate nucleotidyltransferase [Candidatus Dojkabacteria bacterium]|nr:sugar phosphate nucleotidyltransferase [Candidatus Dojkabacteria bacterium]